MNHIAYLYVCYRLGRDYHSGQSSRGYKLLCQAMDRCQQYHPGISFDRMDCCLSSPIGFVYPKNCAFRKLVAFYLNKLRKYRWEL